MRKRNRDVALQLFNALSNAATHSRDFREWFAGRRSWFDIGQHNGGTLRRIPDNDPYRAARTLRRSGRRL